MSTPLNDAFVPSQATRSSDRSGAPDTRLRGRRLILARVAWVAAVTLLVALFILMLPADYTIHQTVCTGAPCGLFQPTPDSAQAIQKLGISIGTYATFTLALTIASAFLCFALSAVIFWRRSDDWMALLVALGVVAIFTWNVPYALYSLSAWQVFAIVLNVLGSGVIFLVFSLFPDGRFVPRWTRWLLPCWVVAGIVYLFFRNVSFAYPVFNLVWYAELVLIMMIAQVYRHHSTFSPIPRQQSKWFIFGGCVAVIITVGLTVPPYIFPSLGQAGSFYRLVTGPAFIVTSLIVPLIIGLAILRYRLYDIDIIIHRTLVYSTLTVLLAAVYEVSVITIQSLTGGLPLIRGNQLAIVASTFLIGALFKPVRDRTQKLIDRRFYRRKYDAAKTLAAFNTTIRDEVDLNQLCTKLMAVVQETMQPAHVSLWLRSPQRHTEELLRLERPHTMEEGY
jgi:hypothetical protein